MQKAKVGFILLSVLLLIVLYFNKEEHTHTSIFCAYGVYFVEFEDGNSKWGTMMLDRNGRPVTCDTEKKTIEHIGV